MNKSVLSTIAGLVILGLSKKTGSSNVALLKRIKNLDLIGAPRFSIGQIVASDLAGSNVYEPERLGHTLWSRQTGEKYVVPYREYWRIPVPFFESSGRKNWAIHRMTEQVLESIVQTLEEMNSPSLQDLYDLTTEQAEFLFNYIDRSNGSKNNGWTEISFEDLKQIPLRPNQFLHGLSVDGRYSTDQEAYKKVQDMGFEIKRSPNRPQIGSAEQREKTPDMGTYLTKQLEEARWYARPFIALVEIPYDKMNALKIDEDLLGIAITPGFRSFHPPSPILDHYSELIGNAFRRVATIHSDRLVPGDMYGQTFGELLDTYEKKDYNRYQNSYPVIGRLINEEGLLPEEQAQIQSWINSGLLEIPNYFMPTSVMQSIPIKKLYKLTRNY